MSVRFEQNCMVQLFDENRVFNNHLWQRVDAILEYVSVTEIIF